MFRCVFQVHPLANDDATNGNHHGDEPKQVTDPADPLVSLLNRPPVKTDQKSLDCAFGEDEDIDQVVQKFFDKMDTNCDNKLSSEEIINTLGSS
jgi:hypothetical protein